VQLLAGFWKDQVCIVGGFEADSGDLCAPAYGFAQV
jgi:hypothetical protein